ncbi:hypothetical protein GGI07_003919 [Coemansia sp. Benny D115]|nr:hypothetical protein GGI07_003919 [Coemansia sp. Benny D115]
MSHFNALPFPATNNELPEMVVQALDRLAGPAVDSNGVRYELALPLERGRYSACPTCGISFNMFRRKNNCVNCGQVVCSDCLMSRWYLPKYGLKTPVPCCVACDRNLHMSIRGMRELESCSVRELRAYLQLYGLYKPTTMIEKGDLIASVYNNSPMPQANEVMYRQSLPRPEAARDQQPQRNSRRAGASADGNSNSSGNSATGSWDRMFSTIGNEIGRGMENLGERLSEALGPELANPFSNGYTQVPQPPSQSQSQSQSQRQREPIHFGRPYSESTSTRSQSSQGFSWANSTTGAASGPPWPTSGQRTRAPDLPDLRTLVRDGTKAETLSVKVLKGLLDKQHVDYSSIVEKRELIQRVEQLIANTRLEMEQEQQATQSDTQGGSDTNGGGSGGGGVGGNGTSGGADENLCKICWDSATNVVFTPCGHLCTCLGCAEVVMKQERKECPICREYIRDYIRVFRA